MVTNTRALHFCLALLLISTLTLGLSHNGSESQYHDQCQIYNGVFCKKILNSTGLRFINTTLGFNNTEQITEMLGRQADNVFETSKRNECKPVTKKVICHFIFPPCSSSGKKVEYCREDCKQLFRTCGSELNKLLGAGKAVLHGKASGLIFRFDECDQDFKSMEDYIGTNDTCQHLTFVDLPPKDENDETSSKTLVIILCVLCPIVLLLLGLFFYLRIRSRKRALSVHYEATKDDGLVKTDRLSNIISMRDRIREWKVAPSELIELVDICKRRGLQEMPVDNIEYLKDLGSGQYGLVFQGKVNEDIEGETSRVVAVKTLREGSSQEAIKEFCQEVNIMSTFSHPHVVKLIGVSLAEEPYCMIFEFVEFGDLASFLRNCAEQVGDSNSSYPKVTVTDQLAMALQVGSAMKYISSIRCVHRDLAARNCLVGRGLVVKISDFGLSRDVYASEYYRMEKTRMLPVRWLPPEAFTDGKFTVYSDIYSYGVLLWELFTFAKLPYEDYDNSKTMELILDGQILEKPHNCPDAVYDIMKKCWCPKPEDRIMFEDIINELCSLDDNGQRFEANEEQIVENYSRRLPMGAEAVCFDKDSNSLSYNNTGFGLMDEAPINVERLSGEQPTGKMDPNSLYSTPRMRRNVFPGTKSYDGVVVVPASESEPLPSPRDTNAPKGPLNNPSTYAPYANVPVSPSKTKLIPDDVEDSQETYDVPPPSTLKRQLSRESGIQVDGEEPEETYDVPPPLPLHRGDNEGPQETYDIPPKSPQSHPKQEKSQEYGHEPQETYDVPPTSATSPQGPQETYEAPPKPIQRQRSCDRINGDDEGPQETYDLPPKLEEKSLKPDLYSVPKSPYPQRRENEGNETSMSSQKRKKAYENVDFDGKPLLSN